MSPIYSYCFCFPACYLLTEIIFIRVDGGPELGQQSWEWRGKMHSRHISENRESRTWYLTGWGAGGCERKEVTMMQNLGLEQTEEEKGGI